MSEVPHNHTGQTTQAIPPVIPGAAPIPTSGETALSIHENPPVTLNLANAEDDFAPAKRENLGQRLSRPSVSYWKDAWIRLKRNKQALTSLYIIIALTLFTLVGPYIWTMSPSDQDLSRISEPPSWKKTAVVLPELQEFQAVIAPNVPETPAAPTSDLPAVRNLQLVGTPSTQAVRLKWEPAAGAAGYVVYRNEQQPKDKNSLGLPIAEVDGGNHVSYEDTFELKSMDYYYAIVAKNSEESPNYSAQKVTLKSGIPLTAAQGINPEAKVGDTVILPSHPLGTDYLGRDMLSRLIEGARISLFIGFFAPLLATAIGILVGGTAGFFGGAFDARMVQLINLINAFPFLLFMIVVRVSTGSGPGESGIKPMLFTMVALTWTTQAQLTRGQILQLRESEFVQASKLLGAKPLYLIFRHLVPNTLGVILVTLTFAIPTAIFTEAFLSFIGMGVVPPTPSWGSMCSDGISRFMERPHEFLFPALFIILTVLAFNLLGDGLRDALDPKMRSVE